MSTAPETKEPWHDGALMIFPWPAHGFASSPDRLRPQGWKQAANQRLTAGGLKSIFLSLLILLSLAVANAQDFGKAFVTTDQAPIQLGEKVIARAKKGEELMVGERRGEWYCVLPSRGWIHEGFISVRSAAIAKVSKEEPPPTSSSAVAARVLTGQSRKLGGPPPIFLNTDISVNEGITLLEKEGVPPVIWVENATGDRVLETRLKLSPQDVVALKPHLARASRFATPMVRPWFHEVLIPAGISSASVNLAINTMGLNLPAKVHILLLSGDHKLLIFRKNVAWATNEWQ